ncbi:bifunctional lysylphosphatidylglycerol flippase/synthetase MprF [Microbaculum marinum]|uniref:Phosphatidylglycerol lysyltransferase n=1 Tax=Microbaculum marinum TaxID=1764581 RepID=A0AAW9S1T1_9HYPH
MTSAAWSARLRTFDTRQMVISALTVLIAVAAVLILRHQLAHVSANDIRNALASVPSGAIALSLLMVVVGYACLASYDWFALRILDRDIPARDVLLTGFTSYAFSNSLGFALLTGGSIRYRAYSALKVPLSDIALITIYSHIAFVIGAGSIMAMAGIVDTSQLAAAVTLPPVIVRALAIGGAVVVVGYLAMAALGGGKVFEFRRFSLPIPTPQIAFSQFVISTIDVLVSAAALYLLVPVDLPYGFLTFAGITVAAFAIGAASHVPGGLGVVEAVLLLSVPADTKAGLFAAILAFRLFYFILPLGIAVALVSAGVARSGANHIAGLGGQAGAALRTVAPQLIGAGVFLAGAVMIFSAAIPAATAHVEALRPFLPLSLLEASHLISSLAGLALLILSRGLMRRLAVAWRLTVITLALGTTLSLFKGLGLLVTVLLAAMMILVVLARPAFHRRSGFAAGTFSLAWVAAIGAILVIAAWFGFFSYRHVEYRNELWWQFAWSGDAPRFLRAMIVVGGAMLLFLIWRIQAPTRPAGPSAEPVPDSVRALLAYAEDPEASVVLLGDKRLLVTPDETAFIMYQIQGNSWIALGEPVGTPEGRQEAAWAFRELVDSYGGTPVFYSFRPESLPLFLDLGLTVTKFGEEARVPLANFSLEGPEYKDFRYAIRRAGREGATFEIVPKANVPAILPELRDVSDEWLQGKSGGEKGFSLGFFSDDYLRNFDIAVIRAGDRIVAFANILRSGVDKAEFSIDLMRHRSVSPYGTMDYLFAELMLAAKAEGYTWFDLGMAPLSGFEHHPLAPIWHKVGNFVFAHGTSLYNFTGLRAYKDKFHPVWTPRYMAMPGGFALPRVLMDCATLISGGPGDFVRKAIGR